MRRAEKWMSIILSLVLCVFMGFTQAVAQAAPEGNAVKVDFTNFYKFKVQKIRGFQSRANDVLLEFLILEPKKKAPPR